MIATRHRILIVGVGGQGVLTLARLLGEAVMLAGEEVVLGQLHGMSQRGGSVESSLLIGPGRSSFIPPGGADAVIGLEPLELLRARPSMSAHTRVLASRGRLVPFTMAQTKQVYPSVDLIMSQVRQVTPHVTEIDGLALAREVGVPRSLNIAMLGAIVALGLVPLEEEALQQAIRTMSPERFLEANLRAFQLGKEAVTR